MPGGEVHRPRVAQRGAARVAPPRRARHRRGRIRSARRRVPGRRPGHAVRLLDREVVLRLEPARSRARAAPHCADPTASEPRACTRARRLHCHSAGPKRSSRTCRRVSDIYFPAIRTFFFFAQADKAALRKAPARRSEAPSASARATRPRGERAFDRRATRHTTPPDVTTAYRFSNDPPARVASDETRRRDAPPAHP